MSVRGTKKRERWVKTIHADVVKPPYMFMSWPHGSGCDALFLCFCLGWSSGQGELSWSTTKASHGLFPCSVLSSLQVPVSLSCLLCPTAVTFPGFLPALVKRLNHRGSPPRKKSPSSPWPHCIRLLLFVPFAVPVWHCSILCRFFCTSVVVDGLRAAISWTPALCYKLDDFSLVITDINWTPLCWAL